MQCFCYEILNVQILWRNLQVRVSNTSLPSACNIAIPEVPGSQGFWTVNSSNLKRHEINNFGIRQYVPCGFLEDFKEGLAFSCTIQQSMVHHHESDRSITPTKSKKTLGASSSKLFDGQMLQTAVPFLFFPLSETKTTTILLAWSLTMAVAKKKKMGVSVCVIPWNKFMVHLPT